MPLKDLTVALPGTPMDVLSVSRTKEWPDCILMKRLLVLDTTGIPGVLLPCPAVTVKILPFFFSPTITRTNHDESMHIVRAPVLGVPDIIWT